MLSLLLAPARVAASAAVTATAVPLSVAAAGLSLGRTVVNEFTSAAFDLPRDPLNRRLAAVEGRRTASSTEPLMTSLPALAADDASVRHVVVVGAGFAGLQTAKALQDELGETQLRVTLLDRHNYHLFQPLLYQVATSGLDPQDIGHSVRNVFKGDARVRFRLGTVVDARLDEQVLLLEPTEGTEPIELPYDALVLAVGAVPADYGIPGISEHAFTLKTMQDAVALRNHLLAIFERAELEPDLVDHGAFTFVIAGGGPTGVELAGAIAELTDVVLRKDHPALDLDRVRVVLAEPGDALLGGYHPKLQAETKRALEARGVQVRLGVGVEEVRADGVVLTDGDEIATPTTIWAAGVKANPLAETLGLETTKQGRIAVDDHLRVPGRPEVFVVGDLAGARDRHGDLYPQLSPVAMQQGRHVASLLLRERRGQDAGKPFSYTNKGIMATIGRNDAVAELPLGLKLTGFPAWAAWLGVHIVFLVGWRNRASTLVNWGWNYVTWDRGSRLLFDQDQPDLATLFDQASVHLAEDVA